MREPWRRFDDGVLDLLRGQPKRQQAIDAAVRKQIPHEELRSVLESFESGLGFAWLPYIADGIRAEFRRIMG